MRARNSPGTLSIFNPKKSFSCVLAIITAMPFVKPTTTGRGMNFTAVPKPVTPRISRRTPAIKVDMNNPSTPYFAMMPKTTTTNAPVGPPIWVFDPPRAEITKPATIAQYRPASGGTPEAMAKAIANGSATRPTVMPERRSARNKRFVYDLRHSTDLGSQLFIGFFLLLVRDSGELSFPVNRSEGMTSSFQFLFAASVQAPSGLREEQTGAPILLLALCCACPTRAVQVLPPFDARNLVRLGVETHQELTNDLCAALRKRRGTGLRTRVVTISNDENSRHMVFTQPRHRATQVVPASCGEVKTVRSEQQRLFEKSGLL